MTNKDGNKLLKKWVKILQLSDWKIDLQVDCDRDKMFSTNCEGCANITETIKVATIQIVDEKYYGSWTVPFNFEQTLIHELLHLKFRLLEDSGNSFQDRYMHQLIEEIAKALYAASIDNKIKTA